jgi:hypothetical protein
VPELGQHSKRIPAPPVVIDGEDPQWGRRLRRQVLAAGPGAGEAQNERRATMWLSSIDPVLEVIIYRGGLGPFPPISFV